MKQRYVLASLVAVSVFAVACSDDKNDATTTTAATTVPEAMTTDPMAPTTDAMAPGDIVAVASGNADFSTLVAAVKAAGLVETLQGAGPFTVFAPTNAAFAALPAGLVDKLLLPANKAVLVQILTYHVVPGAVLAADVLMLNGQEVTTLGGLTFKVTIDGDKVMVNTSNVIKTDILASNGVVHVIDAVLVPAA